MKEESEINCKIFKIQDPIIKKATQLINSAKNPAQKAEQAEKLLSKIKVLLECLEYDSNKIDCKVCRNIAELRKKTAELIIKASSLA